MPVYGASCPGGDVVFVCNITFSEATFALLQWRETVNFSPIAEFRYNGLPANKSIKGFIASARAVPPGITIHSTITLLGVLLFHHNMILQCWTIGPFAANETVTIAGRQLLGCT